jgi:RNA polymerase sigma factor (sigma-70 family)
MSGRVDLPVNRREAAGNNRAMEQPTDAELLAQSREEPAVFAGVYERYATTIYRYAARRVGPSDAEALMAETFRIAFERRATYDTTRPVARPWLYGIATNLVARHRRTEARRWRALARLEPGVETADDSDRVVDAVAAARLLPDVVSAISRLAATDRDALLLHVWEHLTYEDVAAALGIPVGTVRSRINRARTKLRELTAVSGEQLIHADVFTANKERLMTTITGNEQPEVFDHRSRMYPRLAYRDEHAALEYLTRVFGFTERREARVGGTTPDGWDMGDHMLAWLEFGAGLVMIGHVNEDVHRIRSPRDVGSATVMINVEVDDVDAHYARAVAEGAEITKALEDTWYGARVYEAADLEGHQWHFQESNDHIRARGGPLPS